MLPLAWLLKAIPFLKSLNLDLSRFDKAGVEATFRGVAPAVVSRLEADKWTIAAGVAKRDVINGAMFQICKLSLASMFPQIPAPALGFVADKWRDKLRKRTMPQLVKVVPDNGATAELVETTWKALLNQIF